MLKELLVCVLVGLVSVSCNDSVEPRAEDSVYDDGNRGGNSDEKVCPAVNAADHGLQLVLPFRGSDGGHAISQSYNGSYSHKWNYKNPDSLFNSVCAVDFQGQVGDAIVASAPGRVIAGEQGSYTCSGKVVSGKGFGNNIYVDHGNGCWTHYAHLDSISVQPGQEVEQGQLLGHLGNTGCSTGPHLHLAMHCKNGAGAWEPVRPEPISDIDNLGEKTGTLVGSYDLPNLPVGTLIKGDSSPSIYLVCGEQKLCHYADIEAFRSRRPWLHGDHQTAQVVNVSDAALKCYGQSTEIVGKVQMKLVTCGTAAYLVMSGTGETRRRVPYPLSSINATVLLKSWGFHPNEAVVGQSECNYPLQDDLTLRPGTLMELASETDFHVVTSKSYDGGLGHAGTIPIVRRINRFEKIGETAGLQPFASFLYGSYSRVLMVPDDKALTMTNGLILPYGPNEAARCANVTGSGGTGDVGATTPTTPTTPSGPCTWHDHRCTADLTASQTCTMNFEGDTQLGTEWMTYPCQASEVCEPASGRCVARPTTPETATPKPDVTTPTVIEEWPSDLPHTVRCRESQGLLEVRVTGPVLDALMARPTTPASLQYGSDADGWGVPYQSGKTEAAWLGDSAAMVLTLPAAATHFNLYVEDAADATRDSWFDLNQRSDGMVPWTVVGDCHLGVREIMRGAAAVVETTTPVTLIVTPTVTPPKTTSVTPVTTTPPTTTQPTDPPYTIRCTATAIELRVTVTGPILGSGLMADPTTPSALMWGSDTVGGWTVPYAPDAGGTRTQTPWQSDGQPHELLMSLKADRFNLYVADAAMSGQNSWFRLKAADGSPWTVTGDCHLGDGVILRNP